MVTILAWVVFAIGVFTIIGGLYEFFSKKEIFQKTANRFTDESRKKFINIEALFYLIIGLVVILLGLSIIYFTQTLQLIFTGIFVVFVVVYMILSNKILERKN